MNFKKYAKLYELFYEKKKFLREIKFVKSFLKNENLSILDIGCGTGKFANYLSKYNRIKKIDAIDFSNDMLRIAKIKKNKKINYINSDFKKYHIKTSNKYDCITFMFHVINYVHSDLSLNDIFLKLKKFTKKNSLIILDTWTIRGLKKNDLEIIVKKSINNKELLRLTIPKITQKKIINIDFHFFKNLKKLFIEKHKMMAIDIKELERTAIKHNFKIIKKFKNFNKDKFDQNNLFATLVMKRL